MNVEWAKKQDVFLCGKGSGNYCAGIFPNSTVNHTMVRLFLTRSEKILEAVQRTGTLNQKRQTIAQNTLAHTHKHTRTHRRPCLCTGPDMFLRVEGTRAASTGYDKKSYYTRARATFIDEQFFMSFFHFWSLLPITIKLNLLHVSRWSC